MSLPLKRLLFGMFAAVGLGGCTDQITLDDHRWPTRGALILPDADDPQRSWLVITNSSLPCEPATDENNPRTPLDEAASAREFWLAEILAATQREDALLVVVALLGDTPESTAPWPIRAGPLGYDGERVARAGWSWVRESVIASRENLISVYAVTDAELETEVEWGSVVYDGERVLVDIEGGPVAEGTPQTCENPELAAAMELALVRLGQLVLDDLTY